MMTEDEARQAFVTALTAQLDQALNGADTRPDSKDKQVGFVLMIFPLNVENAGCTVASNGLTREAVVDLLRVQADLLTPKN